MKLPLKQRRGDRRGAVAVEFAVIAPVLLAIVIGLIEVNRVYDTQHLLETAAREGARFASMDRESLSDPGVSINDQVEEDVLNFLEANGVPRDELTVSIVDYEDPTAEFDLNDPDNDLRLFTVEVSVDYSEVSFTPVSSDDDYPLRASVTFRNGVASLSQ